MVKIKGITEKEARAITEYETLLSERFPGRIRRLILFGSKARGDSNPRTSDVDILVVVGKNDKHLRKEIVGLTHEPIAHFGVDLSPIIVEEREFKFWSPLLAHVKKEGITLWTNKQNM